jgi:hypothetical protein
MGGNFAGKLFLIGHFFGTFMLNALFFTYRGPWTPILVLHPVYIAMVCPAENQMGLSNASYPAC